jgi:hypothetical protein
VAGESDVMRSFVAFTLRQTYLQQIVTTVYHLKMVLGPKHVVTVTKRRRKFDGTIVKVNMITRVKSRRMRLAGHVACMREKGNAYKVLLWETGGESTRKEDEDVSWRMLQKTWRNEMD